MQIQTSLSLLAAAACVEASPFSLRPRDVVDHDSIDPFPEMVPDDAVGNTIKRFEPYLNIADGCQSYPAVDADGNTSGGLDNTGGSTEGCEDDTKGQTYVRSAEHNGRYAIMYSWYMPKDQPLDLISIGSHRHDWENIVVWVDDPNSENSTLLGAAASAHGEYEPTTTPQTEGDRVLVEYFSTFPTNHELGFTDTVGADLPIVYWDLLPQASRDALENTDFESATVPFKESTFSGNLDSAWIDDEL